MKVVKSVGVSYKFSPIQHLRWPLRYQLIKNQTLVSVNGRESLISYFHQRGTQRSSLLVSQNTLFWNYSNLKSAWRILENILLKLLQLNARRHGPITEVHSTTCRGTSFSMQSVPYSKVYSLETSTPESPQRTGPVPWWRMFHPFTLLHCHILHNHHQQT